MTNLSVNINKIATLRNARGGNNPDLLRVADDCVEFGANGITVHPRPDERHIRRQDVYDLRPRLRTEFNIEGYPSPEFIDLVLKVRPTQVTLVPDAPDQLTSNAGWNMEEQADFLAPIIDRFRSAGIRTSVFVEPDPETVRRAAGIGADCVELYTKHYADAYERDPEGAVAPYVVAAEAAHKAGLLINAGHDLSLKNLAFFHQRVPHIAEVSIGHALICDALYLGLEQTIKSYKDCLRDTKE